MQLNLRQSDRTRRQATALMSALRQDLPDARVAHLVHVVVGAELSRYRAVPQLSELDVRPQAGGRRCDAVEKTGRPALVVVVPSTVGRALYALRDNRGDSVISETWAVAVDRLWRAVCEPEAVRDPFQLAA